MFLYRGKNIGGQGKLSDTCLQIISDGEAELIYEILPHIRVVRAKEFFDPLVKLLNDGSYDQRAAAAAALGSLGWPECIEPLRDAFRAIDLSKKRGAHVLQAAIVTALGEIPAPVSVKVLNEISAIETVDDTFARRRPTLIVGALGQLAQQEVLQAEVALIRFLSDGEPAVRSLAVTEIALAYWHRPNLISGTLLQQILDLTGDPSDDVGNAAIAALNSLAQLGCHKAEVLIDQAYSEE
jgi:HEAT repeat protein